MEAIVRVQIMSYFLQIKLFRDKQYGFIKGRPYVAAVRMLDSCTNSLEDGGQIDVT